MPLCRLEGFRLLEPPGRKFRQVPSKSALRQILYRPAPAPVFTSLKTRNASAFRHVYSRKHLVCNVLGSWTAILRADRRREIMTYVMTKPCPICKQQLTKKIPTQTVQCSCGKHVWQG